MSQQKIPVPSIRKDRQVRYQCIMDIRKMRKPPAWQEAYLIIYKGDIH